MIYPLKLLRIFYNRSQRDETETCVIKNSRFYAYCCGIVGYLGQENTNEILLHGIEAMKNRGYDSCGVCTLEDGKLKVTKCCSVGTPADSYNILKNKVMSSHKESIVGIGHTRWATVGKNNQKNSHPHVDLSRNLALVHNGTISNIEELYHDYYKDLIEQRFKKCSLINGKNEESDQITELSKKSKSNNKSGFKLPESDTEAIAIFIGLEYEKEGDLFTAFKNTIKRLKGTWALCMMSAHYPNSLFVAAHEGPLLFARSDKGIYVGSEPTVFTKYVDSCVALRDGEVFELSMENVDKYYRASRQLILDHQYIEETHEPYPNWYAKELSDQIYIGRIIISLLDSPSPDKIEDCKDSNLRDVVENLLDLRLKYLGTDNLSVVGGDPEPENKLLSSIDLSTMGFRLPIINKEYELQLRSTKRLLFVACGTSLHAATYVAKILQKLNHFQVVETDDASDLTLYRYFDKDNTVVHISNSGETMDCILAANFIRKINPECLNMSLINTLHSTLERSTHETIHLRIGPEKSVPSTKAFMAQVAVLLILGLSIVDSSNPKNRPFVEDDGTDYSTSMGDDSSDEFSDTPYNNIDSSPLDRYKYLEHYGSSKNYTIHSLYRSLSKFPSAITKMLQDNPVYDEVAKKLLNEKVVYILGRGCGHVVAKEASLKMKEVAYIQAEGVLSGAMKHGYYAMIVDKEQTPTISIITSEDMEMTINSTMQLKARGSFIIAITDLTEDLEFADLVIRLPNIGALTPALAVIPMQIISSKIALLSGRNPDIPRGLAKTVTTL